MIFPKFIVLKKFFFSTVFFGANHVVQGTTFSGVAFAFATNNEAKEDIITEWPGAGSYTKQKAGSLKIVTFPNWSR